MELKQKTIVITGSSKGLGKELARLFIARGANVVLSARKKEELEEAIAEIGGGVLYVADVTKEEDLKALASHTVELFGGIDMWINNAGGWLEHQYAEDFDMTAVKQMFDVNVFGTLFGSRVALSYMKKEKEGTILNIISLSALNARPKSSMYAATKWAVNGFTKSIREENKDTGVSILSVFPSGFKTGIFQENKPAGFEDFMETEYVAKKIVENLEKNIPEAELIITNPDKE